MARSLRAVGLFALVVVGSVVPAGCGNGSSGGTVDVTLTDYDVILSSGSVGAGTIDFVIDNRGGFVHEILLVRSDLPVDELPTAADGRFDEKGADVEIVASARDIPAGGASKLVEKLDAGGHHLVCNRPAEPGDPLPHFGHSMFSPFTVT